MEIPTATKAGAVTALVTTLSTGANKIDKKNNIAVVQAVNPVLPPASTPAVDSTKEVTVEVPRIPPITVPVESATNACSILSNSPFSSTKLVLFATEINVPAVSKNQQITMKIMLQYNPDG